MEFLENEVFLIAATFTIFWIASTIQKRTGWVFFNPMLLTIISMILLLTATGLEYETYKPAGKAIEFWLKPAIVALAVPLYNNLGLIRKQFLPIIISQLVGCVIGIISVVWIAKWCGASRDVILSLAPKSITTPIAIEVSQTIGGIPSLTAAIVVCVGIIGAIIGIKVMSIGRVTHPHAMALGMGTAAHVIGTSRIAQLGPEYSAFSTVALIINGTLTAMLAGPIINIIL